MIANAIEIVTKFASAISSDPLRISLNNGSTKNNNKYDKKLKNTHSDNLWQLLVPN